MNSGAGEELESVTGTGDMLASMDGPSMRIWAGFDPNPIKSGPTLHNTVRRLK